MLKSKKDVEAEMTVKRLLALPGSLAGLLSLALALMCAVGYGVTQSPLAGGYAGEVERQWRDGALLSSGPGPSLIASGDIHGQSVTDQGYQLTVGGIYLAREVSIYQWVESCGKAGVCKVAMAWRPKWMDASKFKTPGYANPKPAVAPQQLPSLVLASRARVGDGAVTARVASRLGAMAKPYRMGADDVELAGWYKSADGYQNFVGEPVAGSVKVSFKTIDNGIGLTVAGRPDRHGDIDLAKGSAELLFKEGAMSGDKLLGLDWWALPRFGWVLLGLSAALFAAGAFGLWTARAIEIQIVEERRRRDADRRVRDRRSPGAPGEGSPGKAAQPDTKGARQQK